MTELHIKQAIARLADGGHLAEDEAAACMEELMTGEATPAQFGAGMLAHSVVAYAAAWSRVVFFAENYLVHFGTFLVGCWLRNILVVLLSGLGAGALLNEALIGGPLQGLATALVGTALLFGMREWLGIRLEA